MPEPGPQHDPEQPFSGGASLPVNPADALATRAAAEHLRRQLYDLLARGIPVSITVPGAVPTRHFSQLFARLCEQLRAAAEEARVDGAAVAIALAAGSLEPETAWRIRRQALGPGPVYLLMNKHLMRPTRDTVLGRQQERFWSQCWQMRAVGSLRLAFSPMVVSPCPLLSAEPANGVLPPSGLQVPAGSAWITRHINVAAFAADHGELDMNALHAQLRQAVESGEKTHNETEWPTAAMRHDAWLNRRVAIEIQGIGDLAVLRGVDPHCFQGFKELDAVLQSLRAVADTHSRLLARRSGSVPALEASNPCYGPADAVVLLDWQLRWRQAMDVVAVRHRNLVSMSPWSLFPGAGRADCRYFDLLPLLRHADLCRFPRPPCLDDWNVNKFKQFHSRAWAVLERRDARQLIAEQV